MLGGTAPSYLFGRLTLNNRSHNTRSSQSSLVIPHHGTYGKSAFRITGVKLWNNLPASIKYSPSLVNFKKKVNVFYMTIWCQSSRVNLFSTSQLLMFYRFYFCIRTLLWFLQNKLLSLLYILIFITVFLSS